MTIAKRSDVVAITAYTVPKTCFTTFSATDFDTQGDVVISQTVFGVDDPACYPPTNTAAAGYYSPATCPTGWSTAGTWQRQYPGAELANGEYALECCLSKYTLDTAYAHSCASTISDPIIVTLEPSSGSTLGTITTATVTGDATNVAQISAIQVRFKSGDASKLGLTTSLPKLTYATPTRDDPPLAPLTTVFSPPSSCFQNFYSEPTLFTDDISGTVTSTLYLGDSIVQENCYPTSFKYAYFQVRYYSPGVCPHGYTMACSNAFGPETIAGETAHICCPTGYHCFDSSSKTSATSDFYHLFCSSTISTPSTIPLTYQDSSTTTSYDTTTVIVGSKAPATVRAYAIQVRFRDDDQAILASASASGSSGQNSNSNSTSHPNSASSKSKGLSTGALAGIAVGAVLLALLGAFLIWWFWWRRRGSKGNQRSAGNEAHYTKPELDSSPVFAQKSNDKPATDAPKSHPQAFAAELDDAGALGSSRDRKEEKAIEYKGLTGADAQDSLIEIDTGRANQIAEMDSGQRKTETATTAMVSTMTSPEHEESIVRSAVESVAGQTPYTNKVETSSAPVRTNNQSTSYTETMAL